MKVSIASSGDLGAALRVIEEALRPASVERIEEWLAELSIKTAKRKSSEIGAEMMVTVYTGHLRQYPADAVRFVLSGYSGKWWPTWADLAERLDEITEPRLMIRDRLLDMLAGGNDATAIDHDPVATRLALLRDQLAAAERVATKYPELADSTERKAQAIRDEIQKLEA